MTLKPDDVFGRDREWAGLTRLTTNAHPGALLGVASGRRRQGKSFLLQALVAATGGLYFPALEETEAVSLREFGAALVRQGIPVSRPLQDWGDAIGLLLSAVRDRPRAVVIDEFPFLVKASEPVAAVGDPARARPRRPGTAQHGAAAAVRLGDVGHGPAALRVSAIAWPGQP